MKTFIIEYWPLIAILLAASIVLFFVKRKVRSGGVDNEIIVLPKTNYVSNPSLSTENDFIAYVCNYAERQKIPRTESDIGRFITTNFEEAKFGYVRDTGKKLFLNNIRKTLDEIIKKYVTEKPDNT